MGEKVEEEEWKGRGGEEGKQAGCDDSDVSVFALLGLLVRAVRRARLGAGLLGRLLGRSGARPPGPLGRARGGRPAGTDGLSRCKTVSE